MALALRLNFWIFGEIYGSLLVLHHVIHRGSNHALDLESRWRSHVHANTTRGLGDMILGPEPHMRVSPRDLVVGVNSWPPTPLSGSGTEGMVPLLPHLCRSSVDVEVHIRL